MQCCDCGQGLDDALILVCDHNLCLSCAAKKSASKGSIVCQVCSAVTQLEVASAQQLREMFPQYSMLAIVPQRNPATPPNLPISRPPLGHTVPFNLPSPVFSGSGSRSSVAQQGNFGVCGQCERQRGDLRCMQCEEVLCSDCSEFLHKRGKMALHQIVPMQSNGPASVYHGSQTPAPGAAVNRSTNSIIMDRSLVTMRSVGCVNHSDEPVQYFCLRCESHPMCAECVFRSEEHRSHIQDVVLVRKAIPKIKNRINELIVSFDRSIKEVKLNEMNLMDAKKSVETIRSNSKMQLEKYFGEVREELRRKEQEIMSSIESVVEKELGDIYNEISQCSKKRERIESVSSLLNSVRDSTYTSNSPTLDGVSANERDVEILESFAEMKSMISGDGGVSMSATQSASSRQWTASNQLFVAPDSVSRMNDQIDEIKAMINRLCGIVPCKDRPVVLASTLPPSTSASLASAPTTATSTAVSSPVVGSIFGTESEKVRRRSTSKKFSDKAADSSPLANGPNTRRSSASSPGDLILMNAIEEAIKGGRT